MRRQKQLAAALIAALVTSPAMAKNWWLELEGRVISDDNVAVDETDTTSFDGDIGGSFEIDTGYRFIDSKDARVEAGFDFKETFYQDRTEFGYQTHRPSINAWRRLDGWRLGINYAFDHALLDHKFFLDQHVISPSISKFVTKAIYLSAFYRYTDKNYNIANNGRDGDNHQGGADAYYYFDREERGFVSIGLSYATEDTRAAEFDHDAWSGRASAQIPFDVISRNARLRLSYSYQTRDYESITPSIGAVREDDRHTLRTIGELDLTKRLKAIAEYRFVQRDSNIPTSDYDENIFSAGLRFKF